MIPSSVLIGISMRKIEKRTSHTKYCFNFQTVHFAVHKLLKLLKPLQVLESGPPDQQQTFYHISLLDIKIAKDKMHTHKIIVNVVVYFDGKYITM